jgi:4-amino-4-deoxy-L-arabinose transferase-like glycosyltransferase
MALPVLYIGAIALFMRIYYLVVARVDTPLRADARQYFQIAMNILRYGVFSSSDPVGSSAPVADSYRAPGYPALIALVLTASRGDVSVAYYCVLSLQASLGAIVAMLMYSFARKWSSPACAFAVGIFIAIWPHLITQGGYALTESLFGFSIVLAVYLLSRAFATQQWSHYVLAGLAMAYAGLVNQVILLLPVVICILFFRQKLTSKLFLFVAIAILPSLAWMARGSYINPPEGRSASSRLFENALIGLEPDFSRRFQDPADPRGAAAAKWVGDVEHLYNHDKPAAYAEVAARIRDRPLQVGLWFLRKPFLLWEWSVRQGAGDIYIYPMVYSPFRENLVYRLIASICFGLNAVLIVAAFAMIFLILVSRSARNPDALLCATVFCYAVVVYTMLAPDARYANPFRPVEIALAVTFIGKMLDYLRTALAYQREGNRSFFPQRPR